MAEAGQAVGIEGLTKRFGEVVALDGVSLDVRPGEFMALLGPSGSGKTTILMAVAGFERADAGRITIGGRAIDALPPHRRDIGMVFQRYALFPHMSVAENLAYPLRRRGMRGAEIARQVEEALTLVRLEGLGARGVDQLSGGQQQRVAIARAIIFRPGVLLMDEPMSALDKKLREQMQMELRLLHRELGTTIILVTHDQEEALSMADRVALLNYGRIAQLGTPAELYGKPADAFVAGFIGRNNALPLDPAQPGRVRGFAVPIGAAMAPGSAAPAAGHVLMIRPEHLSLGEAGEAGEPCHIVESAFGGARQSVLVEAGGNRVLVEAASGRAWQPGETATLHLHPGTGRIFPVPATP